MFPDNTADPSAKTTEVWVGAVGKGPSVVGHGTVRVTGVMHNSAWPPTAVTEPVGAAGVPTPLHVKETANFGFVPLVDIASPDRSTIREPEMGIEMYPGMGVPSAVITVNVAEL